VNAFFQDLIDNDCGWQPGAIARVVLPQEVHNVLSEPRKQQARTRLANPKGVPTSLRQHLQRLQEVAHG
jgi:hypothetical protein